jgi:hypothetical protein
MGALALYHGGLIRSFGGHGDVPNIPENSDNSDTGLQGQHGHGANENRDAFRRSSKALY